MNDFNNTIFLEKGNPFAEELLMTEGLPFRTAELAEGLGAGQRIFIINDDTPGKDKLDLLRGIKAAGSAIIAGKTAAACAGGMTNALSFDFNDFLDDHRSVQKMFSSSGMSVAERVAYASKRVPREELGNTIKSILFEKGLPYIHKWYYPDGARSIFSFKVDLDECGKDDIRELIDMGERISGAMTWFICCSVLSGEQDLVRSMIDKGYELESHGYYHHVYNDVEQNLRNIERSRSFIGGSGIYFKGFSGPMGKWNRAIHEALERSGMEYSSDFGFNYDDLPSFPCTKKGPSSYLEIPVIPLCLGSFFEAGYMDKEAGEFFSGIIDHHYKRKMPIMLYGHPTRRLGRNRVFFEQLISKVEALGSVRNMHLSEINTWWRKRRSCDLVLDKKEEQIISVGINDPVDGLCLRIELPGRREAFVSADNGVVRLDGLKLADMEDEGEYYTESMVTDTLKTRIKHLIDWENITPLEDIPKRDIIKYALRVCGKR